jgi:hypothetical protein
MLKDKKEAKEEKFFCVATPEQAEEFNYEFDADDEVLLIHQDKWVNLNSKNIEYYLSKGRTLVPFDDFKEKFGKKGSEKFYTRNQMMEMFELFSLLGTEDVEQIIREKLI